MSYDYWVIRFVPDVARGEFTNVGVVCGRDGADWAVQFAIDVVARRDSENSDLRAWTNWFEHRVHGVAQLGDTDAAGVDRGWVNALRDRQAGVVQISEPLPIDAMSAREAVQLLFPLLIQRPSARSRLTQTRQSMRAEVRRALTIDGRLQAGRTLIISPRVSIGRQTGQFDFGLRPDRCPTFTNVWAFNISTLADVERDVRSWNYIVGRLRQDGAQLNRAGRLIPVTTDVPIDVVVDPPETGSSAHSRDIFAAAEEAWALNDVRVCALPSYLATAGDAALSEA